MIHIVCFRPGMHRGGRSNPRHATYEAGEHSVEQLRELIDDPEIVVIDGGVVMTEPPSQQAAREVSPDAAREAASKSQKKA